MPVASAAPIAIPKVRRSRLPWSTTVGWKPTESRKSPTTPASCGPAGAGVCAGRRPGAATSAAAMRSGNPTCGIHASFAIFTLLRRACVPRAPAVSGPRLDKSNRVGRLYHSPNAKPEGETESGRQQNRQSAPHDAVSKAVSDVAEGDRPQRVADVKDRAKDANHATPLGFWGDVHQERRERRVKEAVGAARQEPRQEEKRHDRHGHVRPHQERHGGQQPYGGRLDEHGGDDGGVSPARVDEAPATDAYPDRRQGVGGVEEADAVDTQALAE